MCFTARLQQQHRGAALRQPRGQGAARAAGAHHDVVEVSGPAGAKKKTWEKTWEKTWKNLGDWWQNAGETDEKRGKHRAKHRKNF